MTLGVPRYGEKVTEPVMSNQGQVEIAHWLD